MVSDSTPYAKAIADLPIGLIPGTSYTQAAIQLGTGDLLVLYTDGVSESRDAAGSELGYKQLISIAMSVPVASSDGAGQALLSGIDAFRGSEPAADDETIVVIRRCSTS
jgi:sigma-B regulation protein RsbU (phosphoserine phosphatase)